jgi:ABC-type multidrug transport system fused ATPase/permease subunit
MFVDSSLLVVLGMGLLVVDPLMSLTTFLVFSTVGYLLYLLMHQRASRLGELEANLTIRTNRILWESFESYREIVVRNRRAYVGNLFEVQRRILAETKSETAFLPNITKYVIEIAVVLMALILCAVQFSISDAAHAIGVLTVFMAASTRIAPAVLRIQQGTVMIRSRIGSALGTIDLIESVARVTQPILKDKVFTTHHPGFVPSIDIKNVDFSYPEKLEKAIADVNICLTPGSVTAIVGRSGAGKSTLVDLILGIIEPSKGELFISGLPPLEAISKWPGSVGYVPQDVLITSGTVRQNLALGFDETFFPDDLFWEALKIAQLDTFVQELPDGLETLLGDRGAKLSGGQRQRLGIARALFTKPTLLILDEATSAMDGKTEFQISEAIQNLKGSVTILIVAHRLSTLRSADQILYLDRGKVVATGDFDGVRREVDDFDEQAKLMGL